jgi:hypothetical protein
VTDGFLNSCQAWQAYQRRLADARERQQRIIDQAQAAEQAYREAALKHEAAVAEAVATGGQVPNDVPQPSASHLKAVQLAKFEVDGIVAEADTVLASVADEVLDKAAASARTRSARARKAAETLEQARVEQAAELVVVARVRRARNTHVTGEVRRNDDAARTRTTFDLGEYGQLVLSGVDVLEPQAQVGFQATGRPRIELDPGGVTVEGRDGELGLRVFTTPRGGDGGEEARRLARAARIGRF